MTRLSGLLALGACMLAGACSDYSQDTPETVLVSARKMVEQGRADRLPDLVYADSKQMRSLLDQIGGLLGSLQTLALAVRRAYPDEVGKLKEDAVQAAKDGNASGFLQQMIGQAGGRRRAPGQPRPDPEQARSAFDNAMKELFADPYGWLQKSEGRLTVEQVADDTAAIKWDGKAVFGVGLTMHLEKGRWYIVLPTNLPGASQILPKTQDGWDILGSVVQVFDQTLTDLTDDVKKGRCKRLDDLAAKAGEKAFLPAVMVFFAYGKYMEAERPPGQDGQRARRRRNDPGIKPPPDLVPPGAVPMDPDAATPPKPPEPAPPKGG